MGQPVDQRCDPTARNRVLRLTGRQAHRAERENCPASEGRCRCSTARHLAVLDVDGEPRQRYPALGVLDDLALLNLILGVADRKRPPVDDDDLLLRCGASPCPGVRRRAAAQGSMAWRLIRGLRRTCRRGRIRGPGACADPDTVSLPSYHLGRRARERARKRCRWAPTFHLQAVQAPGTDRRGQPVLGARGWRNLLVRAPPDDGCATGIRAAERDSEAARRVGVQEPDRR